MSNERLVPTAANKPIRVLYIHGRGSSSRTEKAQFLDKFFNVLCVDMDTENNSFQRCVEMQERAVREFKPHVVVGSSMGGAIAVTMLQKQTWQGPTILLAQAFVLYKEREAASRKELEDSLWLPEGFPIVFIHGALDSVVPIDGSRLFVDICRKKNNNPLVRLIEISDDEHRLLSLASNNAHIIVNLIRELGGGAEYLTWLFATSSNG